MTIDAKARWASVPLPARMVSLKRDPRGYPVPFIAAIDPDGRPHFSINDPRRVQVCFKEDRCAICGQPHTRGQWFVGGPMSAFHENGWYLDPPLHKECMTYALQVCPFLGAPSYSKRIDDKTVDYARHPELRTVETPTIAERPDLFVAVMGIKNEYNSDGISTVVRPKHRNIRAVEYWLKGELLEPERGAFLAKQIVDRESV